MMNLKERIKKKAGCKDTDGYKISDELGELLLSDLKQAIERDFPLSSIKGESLWKAETKSLSLDAKELLAAP